MSAAEHRTQNFGLTDGTNDCLTTLSHLLNVLAGLTLTVCSGGWLTVLNILSWVCSEEASTSTGEASTCTGEANPSHIVLSIFTIPLGLLLLGYELNVWCCEITPLRNFLQQNVGFAFLFRGRFHFLVFVSTLSFGNTELNQGPMQMWLPVAGGSVGMLAALVNMYVSVGRVNLDQTMLKRIEEAAEGRREAEEAQPSMSAAYASTRGASYQEDDFDPPPPKQAKEGGGGGGSGGGLLPKLWSGAQTPSRDSELADPVPSMASAGGQRRNPGQRSGQPFEDVMLTDSSANTSESDSEVDSTAI